MKKIVVTGGSGGAGRFVVRDLLDHGYEVRNLDIVPPGTEDCPYVHVDMTDYGAVFAAFHGYDAVVHLAANPQPDFDFVTGADRFKGNTVSTYNAFQAAVALGMERVVWASSETALGFPFENVRPDSVPVDETHAPKPQNSYALSKVVCEQLAEHMNRLYGMPFVGLRFSNILFEDPDHPASYANIPGYWEDIQSRRFNLWSYVDARDVAQSVRLSLECGNADADVFIIAAADSIMTQSNRELIDAVFPGVPISAELGNHETMISIDKARRVLGYQPAHSWRTVLDRPSG